MTGGRREVDRPGHARRPPRRRRPAPRRRGAPGGRPDALDRPRGTRGRRHRRHRRRGVARPLGPGLARRPARSLRRRAGEALARLGVPEVTLHRLGEPDQGCAHRIADIAAAIHAIIEPSDVVVVPSRHDRHPDHVAVALASRCARIDAVATTWEAPTWALVHGTADRPTTILELDEVSWAAKQHAVAAFRSQLEALGPDPEDGPVVHPHELAVLLTCHEQFRAVAV